MYKYIIRYNILIVFFFCLLGQSRLYKNKRTAWCSVVHPNDRPLPLCSSLTAEGHTWKMIVAACVVLLIVLIPLLVWRFHKKGGFVRCGQRTPEDYSLANVEPWGKSAWRLTGVQQGKASRPVLSVNLPCVCGISRTHSGPDDFSAAMLHCLFFNPLLCVPCSGSRDYPAWRKLMKLVLSLW